jgi:AbrB family looped-hinge helix DNA binding protein
MERRSFYGVNHMKSIVSAKGQITIPAELRKMDAILPGQEFEITRIRSGEYRLKRTARQMNEGLISLLLACPVKGWFKPLDRTETIRLHLPH